MNGWGKTAEPKEHLLHNPPISARECSSTHPEISSHKPVDLCHQTVHWNDWSPHLSWKYLHNRDEPVAGFQPSLGIPFSPPQTSRTKHHHHYIPLPPIEGLELVLAETKTMSLNFSSKVFTTLSLEGGWWGEIQAVIVTGNVVTWGIEFECQRWQLSQRWELIFSHTSQGIQCHVNQTSCLALPLTSGWQHCCYGVMLLLTGN